MTFTFVVLVATLGIGVLSRVEILPAAALVAFALLPQAASIGYVKGSAPAAILLAIWAVRRLGNDSSRRTGVGVKLMRIGALTIMTWGLYLMATGGSEVDPDASFRWLLAFALGVLLPLLFVTDTSQESRVLWRVWPILSIAIAAYMVLEFAIHANLIYEPIYAAVDRPFLQRWSVYRSHGSFGHPLYAATFFAVSAVAAFGRQVAIGKGSMLWLVASCAGLLTTLSRGGLLALAIAIGVTLLVEKFSTSKERSLFLVYAQVFIFATVLPLSGFVQTRADSSEAQVSADARLHAWKGALEATQQTGWLGSGAGTSDKFFQTVTGTKYLVESSPLQILVSLGIVGVIGFFLIFAGGIISGSANGKSAAVGCLVAFVVSISGYNGIESLLPLMAFLGILTVLVREPADIRETVEPAGVSSNALGKKRA